MVRNAEEHGPVSWHYGGQDNVYHFLKSCMILFKKHNILAINMWKQED